MIWLTFIHVCSIVGCLYCIINVNGIKWYTIAWAYLVAAGTGIGTVAGAHRLWTHRSYKAHWLLRLILMILQTMSVNGTIFSWARDHRTHHKYSDTKYDPKNPSRGFFYSHIGWWMLKKDKEVIEGGSKLNYDDLLNDPIVMFQKKYFYLLVPIFWFAIPAAVPYFVWNENVVNCIGICVFLRSIISLHHYFTVNSLAHLWGSRIYDKSMRPTESRWVNYLSLGEGHHNYHHTFPYDYSSSEKGWIYSFNPGTLFIDFCSMLGLAYDLKKPSKELIKQRIQRTGKGNVKLENPNKNCFKICLKKLILIIIGFFDWIAGLLIASWAFLLGILIKIVYLHFTIGLNQENLFKGFF